MTAMTELFNFLEPWKEERSEIYTNELYKELSSSHILKEEKVSIVARRMDCDEVLFKLLNKPQKYAQVHLTWSGKPEKDIKWPRTKIYDSLEEWINTRMIIDNNEYETE
ncbi:hypothetical protein MJ257_22835 [Paenibacillus timonensis]|uniref:Uncharacterized protein n=2 Tax=Paenibacillus timonensis TaxID=225915 RepID=A0ABW3SI68_9BACL|nr:hypothetical protein [Paenibacillus timonensis]MCH1642939.1 hypothetical protein [Paenibacillus timonensis]